ncbi:aminotransferase class V-fold PLP-dependent enzyme [Acidipila sp. EB88]|uniref:aminotransferase class V-fold PLP-dependent enzyme n=1 Tax=Acidipila sp. EB88 TaxID=2305226 RepID=UPI000F5F4427|nr:aminotransferase class V-fold PLP-dependent enzyme [Acidipila sp. EB88]RRA49503.1 aminotransferase class V-fold PLP-dependent enzyme [Acidipila sp. EB88]
MLIAEALRALGDAALTEERIARTIRPLFARTLSPGGSYLANHTLGRPLDQAEQDVAEATQLWAVQLRDAWSPWLAEEASYREAIAALLGLARADCVVPRVSAGHALRAVLNTLPDGAIVLTTREEFASVAVVMAQYRALGRIQVVFAEATGDALAAELLRQPVRLMVVSQVFYVDGRVLAGVPELAAACHAHGAELLVDAYHALGAVPFSMDALGCDYVIGGCYKYLRGGPGAAFLALSPQVLERGRRPLDTGWFAQEPGAEDSVWDAGGPVLRAGGNAWLEATPPVLTYYQARSGLALTRGLGVERLRAYSLAQLALLRDLLEDRGIPSVGGDAGHGAFLCIRCEDPAGVVAALGARGIVVDHRVGYVRACPDCLTTGEELQGVADALAECLRRR